MLGRLLAMMKPANGGGGEGGGEEEEEAGEGMNKEGTQTYGSVLPLNPLPTQTPQSPSSQSPQHLPTEPLRPGVSKPGIVNTYFKVDSEKSLSDLNSLKEQPSDTLQLPSEGSMKVSQISLCPSTVTDTRLLLDESSDESTCRIVWEVIVPFILAGVGCVFAGVVLDMVKVCFGGERGGGFVL